MAPRRRFTRRARRSGRRPWAAIPLLAAAVVSLALLPQTAIAHDSQMNGGRYVWTSGNFCVRGAGYQNHTYSGIITFTEGPCSYVKYRDPGQIYHRSEYYYGWPGSNYTYCAYVGARNNPNRTAGFQTHVGQDVFWLGCNWGWGVWVEITMDTWHWANYNGYWYPNWGGWPGIRPVTSHCHCP